MAVKLCRAGDDIEARASDNERLLAAQYVCFRPWLDKTDEVINDAQAC